MKKSFLLIACAVFSISVFAQTPATSSKPKAVQTSEQVKKDHSTTQNSKETLAKDKSKKKADADKHVSAKTKKADKEHVKSDKAVVKSNEKTEKKDKKAATKSEPAPGTAGSLSTPPKQ